MIDRTTRTKAREVVCPYCDARPGEPCSGARGNLREACHAERHEAAIGTWAPPDHRLDVDTIARGHAGVAEARRIIGPRMRHA